MTAAQHRPGELPDLLGPGIRLLLVGINPGLRSAALGQHFAGPGNRFWPALRAAGITAEPIGPAEQERLPALGVGLTNLVPRASARASELSAAELQRGGERILSLLRRLDGEGLRPSVVAVLGVTAYRRAFDRPTAAVGQQPAPADAPGWVRWWALHNPSGLNAHARPADHAAGLRAAAQAAGLPLHPTDA